MVPMHGIKVVGGLSMNRKMPCLEMNKLRILRFMVPMHAKKERGIYMNHQAGRAVRSPAQPEPNIRNNIQQRTSNIQLPMGIASHLVRYPALDVGCSAVAESSRIFR